mgnify:CR=1 FL=1
MAGKKFEKGSEEWQFFNDYYKFRQQYYEADDGEEWFEKMMEIGEMLIEKYADTNISEYAKNLVFSHFDDVERRYRANEQCNRKEKEEDAASRV